MKVSIIVPVYKVEKYLHRCVDSILAQTYTDFELILVDDGSPDNCGNICDEYAAKDSRIKVIHKENGGVSSARNAGLDTAKGKYITFIDPDDYIDIDYIEYLYNLLVDNDAYISICLHTIVRGKKCWKSYHLQETFAATPKEAVTRLLYNDCVDTSAWAKLYKTELFKDILYPQGKLFEDIATTYKLFLKSKKIFFGNESKYFYVLRNNSIISSDFNPGKFEMIEMTDNMCADVLATYPDLEKAVLRRRVYARFSILNQMAGVDGYKKEKNEIIDFIKENSWKVLRDKNVQSRDKIALLLLNVSTTLYDFVWKYFGKK